MKEITPAVSLVLGSAAAGAKAVVASTPTRGNYSFTPEMQPTSEISEKFKEIVEPELGTPLFKGGV